MPATASIQYAFCSLYNRVYVDWHVRVRRDLSFSRESIYTKLTPPANTCNDPAIIFPNEAAAVWLNCKFSCNTP